MSYHLRQIDFFRFSPQTYHQIHVGNSVVHGFQVEMVSPDNHSMIPAENKKGGLPVVHNYQFTPKEIIHTDRK